MKEGENDSVAATAFAWNGFEFPVLPGTSILPAILYEPDSAL